MDLVASVQQSYSERLDFVLSYADPRTRGWFFIQNSPMCVWSSTLCYLIFVLWLGPRLMKNRPAFELRWFMILYNAFLVALSLYMVVEILYSVYLNDYNLICEPYSHKTAHLKPTELRMAQALWWYFFSKVIEFMDTVLMVLRKKSSQITFLHVFHHSSMLNIWWFTVLLIPGGQAWLASSTNSFVHIIMYSYYLLNLFPSMRPYLWWKKYITRLQLLQFFIIFVHTVNTYRMGCEFPLWSIINLALYMIIMMALFSNFYIKSYKSSGTKKSSVDSKSQNGHGDFNSNKLE